MKIFFDNFIMNLFSIRVLKNKKSFDLKEPVIMRNPATAMDEKVHLLYKNCPLFMFFATKIFRPRKKKLGNEKM